VTKEHYLQTRHALVAALKSLDEAWRHDCGPAGAWASNLDPAECERLARGYDPDSPPDFDNTPPFQPLWSHKAIIIYVTRRMRGVFGVAQVKAAIDQIPAYQRYASTIQKATVSGRLRIMVEMGELELVDQGSGTRPSLYRLRSSPKNGEGGKTP
jgi:hypothetical protein